MTERTDARHEIGPRTLPICVLAAGAAAALAGPLAAVAQDGEASWTHPMTAWGDPDLQGNWPIRHMTLTPLERPRELGTRAFLNDDEFAARVAQVTARNERYDEETSSSRIGQGHWAEAGQVPQRQASLIVDPPDGRLPELTEAGRAKSETMRSSWQDIPFDTVEDFDSWDRCITRGMPASMFPMQYNNGIEIHQTPGYVLIRLEMIHEVRIVPVDGRPPLDDSIKHWMGESRGRWEGNTLVVETTNFNGLTPMTNVVTPGAPPENDIPTSESMRIVERFTRVDDDTIEYEITTHDPEMMVSPWTVAFAWQREPEYEIYEYACHEGNTAVRYYIETSRFERGQQASGGRDGAANLLRPGDWTTINGDPGATRYSPLAQIDRSNVAELEQAWSYRLNGNSTAVPLVVGGVMYVPSGDRVVALDGETGEEVWVHRLSLPRARDTEAASASPVPLGGGRASTRGVAYWPGDDEHDPRIVLTSGSRLIALDADTGVAASDFGDGGAVDIGVAYGGAPVIYRHAAILGANVGELPQGEPGNARAFDLRSGEKLWEFRTVPGPGEPFHDTWHDGSWQERSGTNMWAFSAPVDVELGLVYLPISSPSPNYYGGGRPGENVFGNSIVALEALTGEHVWHFQTVHHDIWDADMPSAGGLFDFVHEDGRRTPAIAHVGKTSYLFVLDRRTGEPLIEVEERTVPAGDVPGEWYSPTQPFPVRPGPLSRVSFDAEQDLVRPEDTTSEHVDACREVMERSGGYYNEGPFTPFLYKAQDAPPRSTIQLPGGTGGVNWGGVAIDPASGLVYANAHDTSLVGWVEDRVPGGNYGRGTQASDQPYDRASILGPGPYASFNAPIGGEFDEQGRPVGPTAPCYRPPWARLAAVDPNKGEVVWESVLGLDENLPDGKQLVGNSGSAGPSVTAGGLVLVGATNDRRFRAFDAETGAELWSAQLESNANANPMSYLSAAGKQHVAVIAGDRVMVYALR